MIYGVFVKVLNVRVMIYGKKKFIQHHDTTFSEYKLIKKLYRDIEIFIPVYLNTLFIKTFSNKFFILCFE